MFDRLREDIRCVLERDPAARSAFEVLTCYPGVHRCGCTAFSHACWHWRQRWLARFMSHVGRWLTGIEIHPGATVGRRVCLSDHGMWRRDRPRPPRSVTTARSTRRVTLGGTSLYRGPP